MTSTPKWGAFRSVSDWLRALHQKPWRTLERCALIVSLMLLLRYWTLDRSDSCRLQYDVQPVTSRWQGPADTADQLRAAVHAVERQKGPASALYLPEVLVAPAPSISTDLKPGQSAGFSDTRGEIYRFKMGDGVFVNSYRTVASALRSGDLHNCTQYDIILQGSARLMMKDLTQGKEYTMEYKPYEYIVIPARTPHIFEFLEETYMLEWWACDFKAWYFQPYRDIISASLQHAPEANETRSGL